MIETPNLPCPPAAFPRRLALALLVALAQGACTNADTAPGGGGNAGGGTDAGSARDLATGDVALEGSVPSDAPAADAPVDASTPAVDAAPDAAVVALDAPLSADAGLDAVDVAPGSEAGGDGSGDGRSCALTAGGPLVNGGFERPVLPPASYAQYEVGKEPAELGWTVLTNSIDVISVGVLGTTGAMHEGTQALDLVGAGVTGGIQQSFATTPGTRYTLRFAYANNPISTTTASARVTVSVCDRVLLSREIAHDSSTQTDHRWTLFEASFTATGTAATLTFETTVGNNNGGVYLDGVAITLDDGPATASSPDGGKVLVQDIHLDKGMHCIDCHFLQDNHGDGDLYARAWDVEPVKTKECQDCHATAPPARPSLPPGIDWNAAEKKCVACHGTGTGSTLHVPLGPLPSGGPRGDGGLGTADVSLPEDLCGNSLLDPGEECDDGNTEDGDDCTSECLLPDCGNGVVDPFEQCDSADRRACSERCRWTTDGGGGGAQL